MDMGTGKTRTAIEMISRRISAGKISRALWLCPYSIQHNIADDIGKHCFDGWQSIIRIAGIESLSSSQSLIPDLVRYVTAEPCMLVVDESSLVKNHQAIRSQEVEMIASKCPYRLILNGTPISKNEKDLYMQWRILDRRILGYNSFWSFAANHLEYDDKGRIRRCLNVDTLTAKISPYTYQVKREECMSLPDKHYLRAPFSLSPERYRDYCETLESYLALIDDYEPATLYKMFGALQTVTSGNTILSKPLEHMWSVPAHDTPDDNPRIQTLKQIIDDDICNDKCVIFCKYQREINDIMQTIASIGLQAVEFTGRLSRSKREHALSSFAGDAQIMVANKSCAAFGLNLQHCHNEIFYNNDWDYATRIQAEDRVHRLGQTKEVNIWDIYAESTIDERIMECLSRKSNLLYVFQDDVKKKQNDPKTTLREMLCKNST